MPIFPAMRDPYPSSLKMWFVSAVVVDLPSVPVMATLYPLSQVHASSISEITGMFFFTASRTRGMFRGTPGLSTTRSNPRSRITGSCCPARTVTEGRSFAMTPASSRSSFESDTTTETPLPDKKLLAASPVRNPRPTTRTL